MSVKTLRADLEALRVGGAPRWKRREAFERLLRASVQEGHPLDALRRHVADEQERFFACTIPGLDGHVYWDGPKGFIRNDGKVRVPRRWWWAHVNGRELDPYEDCFATCGEQGCINPEHCEIGRGLRRRWYSDEQMLNAIRVAVLRLGRSPSGKEWDRMGGRPSRKVFDVHFGNWTAALRKAGFEAYVRPGSHVDAVDCVRALSFVHERIGAWPSGKEFIRHRSALRTAGHVTSLTTIRRHLGPGWQEALRKAQGWDR
jgi:hypothetical protein